MIEPEPCQVGSSLLIQNEEFKSQEPLEDNSGIKGDYIEEYVRRELPFLKDPNDKPSVWKVLKDAVGKDLTKFCVPVYFNEPLSMVQKVAEIMDYEDVLVQANRC